MALQSLTADVRNPVLGRIGEGASPDMPGMPHLDEILPPYAAPQVKQGDPGLPSAPMPDLPAYNAPAVGQDKNELLASAVRRDLMRRMHVDDSGNPLPGPTSVLGKIGHGFAVAGNVLGDIFAPSTMALIPGTQLNNEVQKGKDRQQLGELSDLENQEAQRAQTQAVTAYTKQRPDIEKAKILQKLTSSLAPKGIIPTLNPDGTIDTEVDPTSPYTKKLQASSDLEEAQAERQRIMSQMGQPGTPLYQQKQRQLDQIDQRIQASLLGLGLRKEMLGIMGQRTAIDRERLNFDEDKTYNPEPTAAERGKGDLANSALERVAEMKAIVAKHPEFFGPVEGRLQNAQAWLGSSDPDAVTYNTAAQYLADHSAGVFGGRGQYITQALHNLTNPKYTPEGLYAALDEAERTARGFSQAGSVHPKGIPGHALDAAPGSGQPKVRKYNPSTGRLE